MTLKQLLNQQVEKTGGAAVRFCIKEMKNKQVYIDLLNKALTVPKHETLCFYNIQDELIDLLNKSKSQSLYTKQLTYLYRQFDEYYSSDSFHSDDLIKEIKDTITILNTPLKELEDIETAIQRQHALDEYHKELPLKLLQLMSDTKMTSVPSYVNKDEKGLYVCFRIPYFKDDSIRGYDEHLVYLNGYPSEYDYVVKLIEDYYKKVNKIKG
jgi:hypothetical protein